MDQNERIQTVAALRDLFETTLAECADQVLRKTELNTRIRETAERLRTLLDPDSRAYRVFERMSTEIGHHYVIIHDQVPRPYAETRDCVFARKWLELLNAVSLELDPSTALTRAGNQYVLPAGDVYDAMRKVIRVMRLAQHSLVVIDSYLDAVAFDLVDAVDDQVTLRLLTGDPPKPIFTRLFSALKAKRATADARASTHFHDRFLILDGTEVWQIGTSFNGLGKATSMMSRITDAHERNRLISEYQSAWSSGQPI